MNTFKWMLFAAAIAALGMSTEASASSPAKNAPDSALSRLEGKVAGWSQVAQRPRDEGLPRRPRRWRRGRDHARFRGGIALSGGGEFLAGFGVGLVGLDGKLGVQINNLLGIYTHLHLSFGGGSIQGIPAITGTLAATLMADFTFADRFFVGAGAGFGVLNAPYGPVFQLSFGGYPAVGTSPDSARRRGLLLGADLRLYVITAGNAGTIPVLQAMFTIGYEAF